MHGNGNGNGNGNGKGSSKLQATITLQSRGGEVSLSVVVSNCYLSGGSRASSLYSTELPL